jgi:hypothetical protein
MTAMVKVDERLKQIRETSLTESRLNQDFLDWLKTKGPSYLLAVLIGVCVYLGVLKWKQYRTTRVEQAWSDLYSTSLPSSLEDLAEKYADVPGLAPQATLRAADALLLAVQADRQLGSGGDQPPLALSDEERQQYLDRARRLYQSLVDADDESLGATLRVSSAMQGLAAVAESQSDATAAKRWYEKAAARAEKCYPDLARRLRDRAASVDEYAGPVVLPAQASLPTPPKKETLQPAALAEPLRELLFPEQPGGG